MTSDGGRRCPGRYAVRHAAVPVRGGARGRAAWIPARWCSVCRCVSGPPARAAALYVALRRPSTITRIPLAPLRRPRFPARFRARRPQPALPRRRPVPRVPAPVPPRRNRPRMPSASRPTGHRVTVELRISATVDDGAGRPEGVSRLTSPPPGRSRVSSIRSARRALKIALKIVCALTSHLPSPSRGDGHRSDENPFWREFGVQSVRPVPQAGHGHADVGQEGRRDRRGNSGGQQQRAVTSGPHVRQHSRPTTPPTTPRPMARRNPGQPPTVGVDGPEWQLRDGTLRFGELHRAVTGISQRGDQRQPAPLRQRTSSPSMGTTSGTPSGIP